MNITKEFVLAEFDRNKADLLANYKPDNSPIAILLGGQPASGKSYLLEQVKNNYPDKANNILFINGDVYRNYCPNAKELMKNDRDNYSTKTQIYSNVFTEELIKEAAKNKLNIVIEGTMRNPDVPNNTARFLKENNYKVDAYVIAANPLITELGIYRRYNEQVQATGSGRLADLDSHNKACEGVLRSADSLYNNKSVDSIKVFSFRGESLVKDMKLVGDKWNCYNKPSVYITQERKKQLDNVSQFVKIGERLSNTIEKGLKPKVDDIIKKLSDSQRGIKTGLRR